MTANCRDNTTKQRPRRKRGSVPTVTRLRPRCPECDSWLLATVSTMRLDNAGRVRRFCRCRACGASVWVFLE